MSANPVQAWLQSAERRYRASPLARFVAWWGGELAGLLPAGFRRCLMPAKPRLWIVPAETGGGDLRIWRVGGQPELLDVFGAGEDADLLRTRWQGLVGGFEDGRPEIRLCLNDSHYLALPVELPGAVEDNLRQALTFQLDQLTPFKPDQVLFDFRIERHESERGCIEVGLRIVPKTELEPLLERVRAFGATVHAIDTLRHSDPPAAEGFNLLPPETRPRHVHARARFNMLLAGATLVVLALVMAQTLMLRTRTLNVLEQEADRLRTEARRVVDVRQALERSLAAANFLAEKRAAQPPMIELLTEVTRRLPDDIWLQQFQFSDDELTVSGQASGSQRVVRLLDDSPLLDSPEFTSPISIDPASGMERFRARARLQAEAGPDPDSGSGSESESTGAEANG